jgi:hypothetical protein
VSASLHPGEHRERDYLDWYDYQATTRLFRADEPFYALVGAAMMRADTGNAARLREAFPGVWADLQARYDAPGAILETDPPGLRAKVLGG